MTGRSFVDTNVIVYLFDDQDTAKQARARTLIDDAEGPTLVVSTQVLSEFYVTVTRKLARPLDLPTARSVVGRLAEWPVVHTDTDLVLAAIDTADRHQLSLWDAMIIEAAVAADCDQVWTEDLSDGTTIRGVTIEDPFREMS